MAFSSKSKSNPACNRCERIFTGNYIQALGNCYHPECFVCILCSKPLPEGFIVHENLPYHEKCYKDRFLQKCTKCGNLIEGTYIQALGGVFHGTCFTCEHCGCSLEGVPMGDINGKAYCQKDYRLLTGEICSICSKILNEEYSIDYWGNKYCVKHNSKMTPCMSCSRLICDKLTGGGVKYSDGTQVCNICSKTAVQKDSEFQNIFQDVKNQLMTHMGLQFHPNSKDFTPRLASQPELLVERKKMIQGKLFRNQKSNDPCGITVKTTIIHRRITPGHPELNMETYERAVSGILVLRGLSKSQTAAISAHELGHAYMFLDGFDELPLTVEEGICEYFVDRWLTLQGRTDDSVYRLHRMKENKDKIYGDGYRQALAAVNKYNLKTVLQYVKRYKVFPQ